MDNIRTSFLGQYLLFSSFPKHQGFELRDSWVFEHVRKLEVTSATGVVKLVNSDLESSLSDHLVE
jgi:hypothetical protein